MAKTDQLPEEKFRAPDALETQAKYNPERDELQKRAIIDWQSRQNPGEFIPLGNGQSVRVQPGMPMKYPGEVAGFMLSMPELLIKPDERKHDFYSEGGKRLGPRYAWRIRTESSKDQRRDLETQRDKRSNRIRYVEWPEIDVDAKDPNGEYMCLVEKYEASNTDYVIWQTYILVENMDPQLAYQKTVGWEDWAIQRQRSTPTDLSSMTTAEGIGQVQVPGKMGVKFTQYAADEKRGG